MLSDTLGSDKILDGTIANADVSPSAAIGVAKVDLGSSSQKTAIEQNIGLLGFKMAVNDSLTIFNLVDGVVDEFHDESGTDEGEGSNDTYCSSNDNYNNSVNISAGFSTTARTESDTSTAGTNPAFKSGTYGSFTVPSGVTSINIQSWGSGGGQGNDPQACKNNAGGGGGYAEGTLAVTGSQVFDVVVGEGGFAGNNHDTSFRKASLGGGGDLPATNAPELHCYY